jgi:Fe-S cluster biogenesis protein NfuA
MSAVQGAVTLKDRVAQILATEIAPALQMNGTDLEVIEVIDGVARIRFRGVCAGCPSTVMSLLMGIEQELRRHVPEVEYIEPVV